MPAKVSAEDLQALSQIAQNIDTKEFTVDLPTQKIKTASGVFSFEIEESKKRRLLEGWDDIGLTLQYAEDIDRFEETLPEWMIPSWADMPS